MTTVAMVAIDVVFGVALMAAASCLVYLVYVTIRERAQSGAAPRRVASVVPISAATRGAGARVVESLRPSVVRQHASGSS